LNNFDYNKYNRSGLLEKFTAQKLSSQRVDNNVDYSVAITNSFDYNNYSELVDATMGTDNYNFDMDNIGNRTDHVINDIPAEYYGDWPNVHGKLNRYSDTTSTNLVYNQHYDFDLDGNMTTITQYDLNDANSWLAWQYTWNAENRMVSATNCVDGTYVTYKYDYQGRMFEKVTNGDKTRFIWNGNHIIAELITNNSQLITNLYVWSQGELLCANLGGTTVFYCHDANKNVTDLVDTSGDSVAHYEYSPFGVITEQSGSLAEANPFRFSNEYFDSTTGFVEYEFRSYIPPLGKFASRDPIGVQGGLNESGICGNDLINKFDMWGLKWKITRGNQYNWAVAYAEKDNDSFKSLANLIKLEYGERTKWLKKSDKEGYVSESDEAKKGCRYKIPNVMAVYTSKSGIGDGLITFVTQLKRIADWNGDKYEEKGYKVVRKSRNSSDDSFIGLWELDGIFAISFAGHGNKYGFKVGSWGSYTVSPVEVAPPYKLQSIGAYSCLSDRNLLGLTADRDGNWATHHWKDHLSNNGGSYVGYSGYANWISRLWNEITINSGDIPE